jgi:RNA recognition motif-containing protein
MSFLNLYSNDQCSSSANYDDHRITRLFCGNLNKKVTEEQLKQCISGITYVKWITDKATKEFYGSTFIEMKDSQAAITAVLQDGTKFLGRPLKIYYCPPKPGDVWPPLILHDRSGNDNAGASKFSKEKTPKPIDGKKLFIGNLSYDIDDEAVVSFFKECGELIGLRWLVNQHTGEFRVSCRSFTNLMSGNYYYCLAYRAVATYSLQRLVKRMLRTSSMGSL